MVGVEMKNIGKTYKRATSLPGSLSFAFLVKGKTAWDRG